MNNHYTCGEEYMQLSKRHSTTTSFSGSVLVSAIAIAMLIGNNARAQHRVIDFTTDASGGAISAGDFISNQYTLWGIEISESDVNHRAMAFDTANPTGGDSDIGAPNQAFNATGGELWDGVSPRGPGVGSGGAQGQPGENRWPLGNALIVSQDNNQAVPNDYSGGGTLKFSFAEAITVNEIWVLDDLEGGDFIIACTPDGMECFNFEINNPDENSFQQIPVNTANVGTLYVELSGSGGIPAMRITGPETNLDWGDAPDAARGYGSGDYYTLGQDDGPNHIIDGITYLGSTVDGDPDGQPNSSASGDDGDGTDDEDGVVFNTPLAQGQTATITVTASTSGLLNAWVDFNGDGLFTGPNEQIFTNQVLNPGPNVLNFPVPGDATLGLVYSRFRFSTEADLSPTGPALNGEVEDYLNEILVPIELTSFSARYTEDAVEIEWITQSEEDNLGYLILRARSENDDPVTITEELIPGAGNSLVERRYSHLDESVEPGVRYLYTLVDVSFDGVETYHGPISVSTPNTVSRLVLNDPVPNPVQDSGILRYSIAEAGHVRLVLYDYAGRERSVLTDGFLPSGEGTATVYRIDDNTGDRLNSGAYIMKLETESGSRVKRIIFTD